MPFISSKPKPSVADLVGSPSGRSNTTYKTYGSSGAGKTNPTTQSGTGYSNPAPAKSAYTRQADKTNMTDKTNIAAATTSGVNTGAKQTKNEYAGETPDYFEEVPPIPGTYTAPPGQAYGGRVNFNGYDRPIPDANVPTESMTGILDIQPEGHGFLRPKFIPSELDIYISSSQIRKFNLKNGDMVTGQARKPKENERYYGLLKVEKANEIPVEKLTKRPDFNDLTPIYPYQHLKMETGKIPISTRLIDLIAPIGRGQRGMIVSPPKAGKTWLLKEIANGITKNHEDVHLMVVLVGERPEEVTDIARSVKGEVLASNFDEPAENQTRAAEIALDRAKRLVEIGKHVVILLDSITRLARAYNLCIPPSGRTLSGGFDPVALYPPKQFFGAARAIENGGSLTIIGTALVDTGSRMDDLIYEEFKGTGNMELHLDRRLAERRIYPSVDVSRSGTRHEELLFPEKEYVKIITMRRMLEVLGDQERTELLIDRLSKTKSNKEFIDSLGK